MGPEQAEEEVFRALADASRRGLLDRLRERNGQRLNELCAGQAMSRQAVTKHLRVLEDAGLVVVVRRGRERLHYLNAAPIGDIYDRWISRYDRARLSALADLKRALEESTMSRPEFVYVTYIRTTPEVLWRALTETAFTNRYWGGGPVSDWTDGAPIHWQMANGQEARDLGQVVLRAEPFRHLSYTWHNYQRDHMELFGWTEEQFVELIKEDRTRVSFQIEEVDDLVKLTVIHDGFQGETEMFRGISQGWPRILSGLKTLLESDEVQTVAGR